MASEMLINVVEGEECRIAVVEDGNLEELYMERASVERHVGNIYKGRVNNVEPTIQAAFVDIGMPKNGFLHVSDVLPSAYPRRKKGPEAEGKEGGHQRRYHTIQEIFRPGDEVVVQITKEGIGTKGPSLTTALSIPGRYLVLMPGLGRLGVSRKIEDESTRRELRDLLGSLNPPQDLGFIVRTAGMGRNKRELQRDMNYLERLYKVVQSRVQTEKAPAEIFLDSDLVLRTLRDAYAPEIETIWVDSEAVLKRVRDFLKIVMPRHVGIAKLYAEKIPLFHRYNIEEAIERVYSRTVPLPKGGSLVIDQTEALVAIDVNSGKFRYGRDAEESAHQLNVMAAKEIARQIRMRDLGGVLIMDFVDMEKAENRRHVEKVLRDAFKNDRARSQMLHISKFGIVEMTRQRVQPSLERTTYTDCPYCKGSGIIKNSESMALEVLRYLRLLVSRDQVAFIDVTLNAQVAEYLQNAKRSSLTRLETEFHKRIRIAGDPKIGIDQVVYRGTDDHGQEVRVQEIPMPPPPVPTMPRPAPHPAMPQPPRPQPQAQAAPAQPSAAAPQGQRPPSSGSPRRKSRRDSRRRGRPESQGQPAPRPASPAQPSSQPAATEHVATESQGPPAEVQQQRSQQTEYQEAPSEFEEQPSATAAESDESLPPSSESSAAPPSQSAQAAAPGGAAKPGKRPRRGRGQRGGRRKRGPKPPPQGGGPTQGGAADASASEPTAAPPRPDTPEEST
jgi:ribonuclease E